MIKIHNFLIVNTQIMDHTYAAKSKIKEDSSPSAFEIQIKSNQNKDLPNLISFPYQKLEISNNTYQVFDVPGDGSCFFHCLSLSIFGNFEQTGVLRNTICSYVLHNWPSWENKVLTCHHPKMNLDIYRLHMISNNGWATAVEIEAASILFKRKIKVFLQCPDNFIVESFGPGDTGSEIELLLSNFHFRVLKKTQIEHISVSNDTNQTQSHKKQNSETYQPYTAVPLDSPEKSSYSRQRANKRKATQNTMQTNSQSENEQIPQKTRRRTELYDECEMRSLARKFGVTYEAPSEHENLKDAKNRRRRILTKINNQKKKFQLLNLQIPDAPPLSSNEKQNAAMDNIRIFELEQMSYSINKCSICHECRLEMKMSKNPDICRRCFSDKNNIKLYSAENNMDPGKLPLELTGLTIIEQQLISKISPCINVHLLKHGGIGSSGHCVTFPQEVNQPAQILPKLPSEIKMLKVRKKGRNDTTKDFNVRRFKVQNALLWLKENNPIYTDIIISQDRLNSLPIDDEMPGIETLEYSDKTVHKNDMGPAPHQNDTGEVDGVTYSSVPLPDTSINIREKVQNIVDEIVSDNQHEVSVNKRGTVNIPWPTRGNEPISEFVTRNFFTLAFPSLFPFGSGDFHVNRPRTCESMADWAQHLLWYEDGRFSNHQYFKFVVHNMIVRKRAIENSSFIVKQKLGDAHLSVSDIRNTIQSGDNSLIKKIIYLSSNLRGTSQYWAQRGKELRSLVQFNINEGHGLPSYFCTGSCAEFYFKPLRRLLTNYIKATKGIDVDLNDRHKLFEAVQENGHLVGHYFDVRTQSYFSRVMGPVFNVNCFWYRQEFAKSRGMIHWHGLCWRRDREPHNLNHQALVDGLTDPECAEKLAEWASLELGMSANHPAGKDDNGDSRKNLWPPPEGSAPAPPEDMNPLVKLLMDASSSQDSLLEDYLLLTNRINIHRCSDYCLRSQGSRNEKACRMEYGTASSPGKELRTEPAIVRDKNKCMRLEMPRDHPMLVQNSRFHTQGWRANGDISIIVSKSDPINPSVNDIIAVEKYVSGYACKGNQPTGAIGDLFQDMVNCADESSGATAKSLCSKLLIGTVKRDISSVEAAYELSSLPLYRCSHTFQSVSFTGFRSLDTSKTKATITKSTIIDRYQKRDEKDESSLYSFICKQGKVPVIGGSFAASFPLEEDYCRTKLIMHWPNWRKIQDIKSDDTSWVSAMETFLLSDDCPNFVKAEIERAKQPLDHQEVDEECSEMQDETEDIDEPEWMDSVRPNANYENISDFQYDDGGPDFDWSKSTQEYPLNHATFIENIRERYEESSAILDIPNIDIDNLNKEQRMAFNIVLKTLQLHNANDEEFDPLRMVITGTAGSGKSFLIKCIVKAVRTIFQSNSSVQVLCPTGNSANLIAGMTIHSFLKIPINQRGKEMTPPDGLTGETLQENIKDVKVLLVDERSLIGANNLGWMEFLCRCGMAGSSNFSQSWGGIPVVVFFGDDVQLPPVLDPPVYNCSSSTPAAMHGVLVWREFKEVVGLKTIVRQGQHEDTFKQVLTDLRQYNVTSDQAKWLQQFQWDNLRASHGDELLKKMMEDGLFVFPTHEEEWNHNKTRLMNVNSVSPVAKITASGKGPHSKTATSDKAGGLLPVVYLCKRSKVMLCVNLCIPYGLFNGAIGTVVDVMFKKGCSPKDSIPEVVMVEFPNYTGPPFTNTNAKIVPIIPVERHLDCGCHRCSRKMIPLKLGWATTIHKCQGMTIGQGETNRYIVIHPGTRSFESRNPGALFVALSRAKHTGIPDGDPDFAWNPAVLVNEDRLCHRVQTSTTKARAIEIARLESLSRMTAQKYKNLDNDLELASYLSRAGLPCTCNDGSLEE